MLSLRSLHLRGALVLLASVGCQAVVGIGGRQAPDVTPADTDAGASADGGGPTPSPDASGDAPKVCRVSEDRCGDVCADLRTDERHCGRCGHGCLGAGCKNGECVPSVWVPGSASVVVSGVWVNGDEVVYRSAGDTVISAPLVGKDRQSGVERAIVEIGIYPQIVPLAGSTVLVVEHAPGARLRVLDLATRAWSVLYAQASLTPAFRNAVVDGDDVYWATRADLRHVKLDGTGYEVVHTVTTKPFGVAPGLALTPTTIYFGVEDGNDLWAIDRAPGAVARKLDAGDGSAAYATIDGGHVLWTAGTAVRELPLPDEGPPTSRTVGTLAAHVAVKRDGAIWIGDANFHKPDPMLSRVVRYDLATHTATVVASNLPAMGQIAVDDRWVYMPMFEKGIWRVAR